MFEFIVLTVDLMKHLKAFALAEIEVEICDLFFDDFPPFLRMKVIKFRKFLPLSSLSKRIFFRCWVLFVSQYT